MEKYFSNRAYQRTHLFVFLYSSFAAYAVIKLVMYILPGWYYLAYILATAVWVAPLVFWDTMKQEYNREQARSGNYTE